MSSKPPSLPKIDHKQYDVQTLHVCEVIACFILNKLYNEIYLNVKELKTNDKIPNLTDGYKQGLMFFFKGLKKPENMKKILLGIHDMFIENPGFAGMTFRDCIHKISDQFTPHNDRDGFNEKQKQKIVMKVMLDVCANYIEHLISNRLGMVIDNRKQKQNVDILKNELINMLLLQRERMLSDYYGVVVGANKTNMPKGFETKLKAMVSDAIRDKIIAQKQAKKYYLIALKFKRELDEMKNTNTKSYHSQPVPPPDSGDYEKSGSESDDADDIDDEDDFQQEEPPHIEGLTPMTPVAEAPILKHPRDMKPSIVRQSPVQPIQRPQVQKSDELNLDDLIDDSAEEEPLQKSQKHEKPDTPDIVEKDDEEKEESSGENLDDMLEGMSSDSGRYGEQPLPKESPKEPEPEFVKSERPKMVKKTVVLKSQPRPAINVAPQSLPRRAIAKKPETQESDDIFN